MIGRVKDKHKVELLSSVGLFADCTKGELAEIASITYEEDVPAGAVLAVEGTAPSWVLTGGPQEIGSEFFIVVSGRAQADAKGRASFELGPGQFFGEMALLDGGPRTATVTALTQMVLLTTNREEFLALLESSPRVALRIITELVRQLRAARS